ncbi:nucleotide exchange factor GrpE [Candidatus Karelsulcia muelleri]|uniref:Protein GrpE n=1 Tax=Candidatus Karelsulcia muelleri PSPU TaxID=1189303 RepID=A0AAD1EXE0_9FLAO|nr:nucleotide exchange factor GrpE [Candidatus Karelsulcia muelleri]NJJ98624.1 nucleotide exchange factor GrpE [Candidatus Karelsulcia muelleri]BAO66281.1 heat shock protein GrpE [Candidatus Karelsulcia muelleri PSPU]
MYETIDEKLDNIEIKKLNDKLNEENIKYIRIFGDFKNFKKRIKKEKLEIIKNANETLLFDLLSVLDDFDRSLKEIKKYYNNNKPLIQGIFFIKKKFYEILKNKGLKKIKTKKGDKFNTDLHEAITQVKATLDELKGKVLSVIEEGYFLNKKVIRYSKVIVGK